MKSIIPKICCAVFSVALIAGCQSSDNNASAGASQVTSPTHVAILFSRPKADYTELGTVSTYKVQPDPSQTWQNTFQKQAAAKGADAVIVNTSTLNNINTPLVSGTAIHFKPKPAPSSQ